VKHSQNILGVIPPPKKTINCMVEPVPSEGRAAVIMRKLFNFNRAGY